MDIIDLSRDKSASENHRYSDVGGESNGNVDDRRDNFEVSFHLLELMTLVYVIYEIHYVGYRTRESLVSMNSSHFHARIRLSPTREELVNIDK